MSEFRPFLSLLFLRAGAYAPGGDAVIFVHFLSPFLRSAFDSYSLVRLLKDSHGCKRRKQRPLSFIIHPRRAPCVLVTSYLSHDLEKIMIMLFPPEVSCYGNVMETIGHGSESRDELHQSYSGSLERSRNMEA